MLTPDLFPDHSAVAGESWRLPLQDADVEYFPSAIDRDLATEWFDALMQEGAVAWRQDRIRMYGRDVPIPRLNAWYGDPGLNYSYSGIPMSPEPWSELLVAIRDKAEQVADHQFTSALINLYRDHTDSVAWHADDEPELGPEPVIASLSLGSAREFHMRHRNYRSNGVAVYKMLLQPGSLLVMKGATQRNWLHQVPKRGATAVTGPRINITFRKIVSL